MSAYAARDLDAAVDAYFKKHSGLARDCVAAALDAVAPSIADRAQAELRAEVERLTLERDRLRVAREQDELDMIDMAEDRDAAKADAKGLAEHLGRELLKVARVEALVEGWERFPGWYGEQATQVRAALAGGE